MNSEEMMRSICGFMSLPSQETSRKQEKKKEKYKCIKEMLEELQEKTRTTLSERDLDPISAMRFIDNLQHLGISYHYEEEINSWLKKLWNWNGTQSLEATSLRFRLLRQNAMPITSAPRDKNNGKESNKEKRTDVFRRFMDGEKFKLSLGQDIDGLLNLYEASYLGGNDDYVLSEAMDFSENQLKSWINKGPFQNEHLLRKVKRALQLPKHLRMERLESRLYIDEYAMQNEYDPYLLLGAKLDYNQVQLLHQLELAEIKRWWKQLGLVDKLSFARDRPMECFLWTVGALPEPKYSTARIELAKTISLLLVLDDMFDTYGTINDLSLFTRAIKRWDLYAIEQLPEYMKICYMALYNTTNEIAYRILKEHGKNIAPFLAKAWIDTIEAFMVEANWVKNGHEPNVANYMENGVATAGVYMALVHTFFLMGQQLTSHTIKLMANPYPKLFSNSGKILRLWDDLGTSKEEQNRGENCSVIPLLMKENNLENEDEAKEHIMELIQNLWKDLNVELLGEKGLPFPIIRVCFNMARTSQVIYQHQEKDTYFSSVDKFVKYILLEPINT